MKNKIPAILIAIFGLSIIVLSLAHTHNYTTLNHDNTSHWYECVCGDKATAENHTGGTATCTTLAKCSVCHTGYGVLQQHSYTKLKTDATQHWYECVCGANETKENHITGAEATEYANQVCTKCNRIITPALGHVHALHLTKVDAKPQSCTKEGNIQYYACYCGKWFTDNTATTEIEDKESVVIAKDAHAHNTLKHNETRHWYECVCGDKATAKTHSGGTATCTQQATCTLCNTQYGKLLNHTYSTIWSYNETNHWQQATCGCDVQQNYAKHVLDDNGCCHTCNQPITDTPGVIYGVSADGTYAEVVEYKGTATKVKIADTYNGLPVTYIYDNTFKDKDKITLVILPNSVTTIGDHAFYDCDNLTTIVIPNRVTTIGDGAFYSCGYLTSVTIPDSVTSIGSSAFAYCSKLKNIYIMDLTAWCNISGLSNLMAYGSTNKQLYLNNNLITELIIPDGVNSIGNFAFSNCSSLTSVTIGNGTTTISNSAFSSCVNLTSITIPNSVTTIGDNAFYNCNLIQYNVSENVNYLGNDTNPYHILMSVTTNNLATYTINPATKVINAKAFMNCTRPNKIAIPDSVTSIGSYAFRGCSSLTSVIIPNSVTCIAEYAFYGCSSLKTVYFGGTTQDWAKISIDFNNSSLTNARFYYYSETQPTTTGNYWHYIDSVPTKW